ncbi:MAG: cation:proton antiporter [bacterium]|nr:cation:proton antiporter [bacterium]
MEELYSFFTIILAGVFFSMISRRMHIPWVVALILGGVIVGPHALGILEVNSSVSFIGQIGLVFLMFMAGLETNLSSFRGFRKELAWLSLINGAVPCVVGIGIGLFFGYGMLPSLLIGIVFISSSIAVVIPSLESRGLMRTRLGQSVVMSIAMQDIASLIILSVVLQTVNPVAALPLIIFYPLLLTTFLLFRYLLPKINRLLKILARGTQELFQQEFRSTFLILLGTVVIFDFLGLHPIISGFFAGLMLANSITAPVLKEKINTISYGIFIPTFFVVIGAETDIGVFKDFVSIAPLILAIVFGSAISKFSSGWLGGRMVGFTSDQSLLFGVSSIPQLSTTLAVTFAALSLGLIDQKLMTAMVILSVATVIIGPLLMNIFSSHIQAAAARLDQRAEESTKLKNPTA